MLNLFDAVALQRYKSVSCASLTNSRLRSYFNACFQDCIDRYGVFQCWACVGCLRLGHSTCGWGSPPASCPSCASSGVLYEIATFQARASIVGAAFASAFRVLMQERFHIPLVATPGNTRTHDFEVAADVAIEVKGSPSVIRNPDGTVTKLGRPGLERSDTRKKAFDNARTHRQRRPDSLFFIVSNAVPVDLVGYRSRDVSAVFDATKIQRIDALATEICDRVGLRGEGA